MFNSIFSNITTGVTLEIRSTILSILVALVLGFIISVSYLIITPKNNQSPNLALSLVILPTIISIIIILIGGNLARAFSMAGVFTLIRYRSVPGDSKDITFVFLSMAAGLSIGLGYLVFGAVITVVLCITVCLVSKLGFGVSKQEEKRLKIMIPEDMNYQGAFDDLFEKYTKKCRIQRVKTTNLGTLFELTYLLVMKEGVSEKELIDNLRCRNGNLNILLDINESNIVQL